jgi:hypothetical protein
VTILILILEIRHSASIIMSVVYGYEIGPRDDPIISIVEKAVDLAVNSIKPEVAAFLGAFPFCEPPCSFVTA